MVAYNHTSEASSNFRWFSFWMDIKRRINIHFNWIIKPSLVLPGFAFDEKRCFVCVRKIKAGISLLFPSDFFYRCTWSRHRVRRHSWEGSVWTAEPNGSARLALCCNLGERVEKTPACSVRAHGQFGSVLSWSSPFYRWMSYYDELAPRGSYSTCLHSQKSLYRTCTPMRNIWPKPKCIYWLRSGVVRHPLGNVC